MEPAVIGQEIDDSVTLLLGTCSITLSFIGDDVFSFRNRYTLSSLSTRNTQHCHPTLKIGGDTFRIIYAGCVCVYSANLAALYPQRLMNAPKLLPSDCYWASHSRKLMNANGDV